MRVQIWGTRGSLPTPLSAEQLRAKQVKLLAEAARLQVDLNDEKAVEQFLDASEHSWTHGGNTSCVEIDLDDQVLILDAGSGIRGLSADLFADGRLKDGKPLRCLFTHFHWDHICGLPFFGPIYIPGQAIEMWSWRDDIGRLLAGQMNDAYFPVKWPDLKSEISCHVFNPDGENQLGNAKITLLELVHPDGAYGYRIETEGRVITYLTDTEVSKNPNKLAGPYSRFAAGSDLVIVDAMYGFLDYHEHYDFGHSSVFTWIDFFKEIELGELVVFHHDPQADDAALNKLGDSARRYRDLVAGSAKWKLSMAREGLSWTFD